MKAEFDRKTLLNILHAAEKLSENPDGAVLLSCDGPACRIAVSDGDAGFRVPLTGTVRKPGRCLLPVRRAAETLCTLPDGKITVEADEHGNTTVTSGDYRCTFPAVTGTDEPQIPPAAGDVLFTIPHRFLVTAVQQTAYAASPSGGRMPAMNGVLFRIRNGGLHLAGCDGSRIALFRCAGTAQCTEDRDVIVPAGFLRVFAETPAGPDSVLTAVTDGVRITFSLDGGAVFFTGLIETEYPAYERILPSSYRTEVTVGRDAFRDAVERILPTARENRPGSPVKLEIREDSMMLTAENTGGSVSVRLPCTVEGPALAVGFHGHLLFDALDRITGKTVRIRLNSPLTGVILDSPEEGDGFHFLMPRRLM